MKTGRLVISFILLLALFISPYSLKAQKSSFIKKGDKYFNKENFIKADSFYTLALEEYPNRDVFFNKALCQYHLNKTDGFCLNLRKAKEMMDEQATELFWHHCAAIDTVFNSEGFLIKKTSKYEDYFEVDIYEDTLMAKCYKSDSLLIYTYLENPPKYLGTDSAMYFHIAEKAEYPSYIASQGIQGIVIIGITILKSGAFCDARVHQSIHPGLDLSALEAIKSLNHFIPATYKSKSVNYRKMIPVKFSLVPVSN